MVKSEKGINGAEVYDEKPKISDWRWSL